METEAAPGQRRFAMQGVWHRIHDRHRPFALHLESNLFAAGALILTLLAILVLLLGVFVTRAS
jgi:hypothetical protein